MIEPDVGIVSAGQDIYLRLEIYHKNRVKRNIFYHVQLHVHSTRNKNSQQKKLPLAVQTT